MLIAGIASDCNSWLPIVTELARRFRVITFDNRGVGRTTPMEAPSDIGTIADDCIALMRHLGLPAAHVLGLSMGGFIAQEVALRAPERVKRLVLAATAASTSRRDVDLFTTWTAALARIVAPTLVLAGGQDLIFPVAACRALAEAIPHARFDVIEAAAHSIHFEFGAEFNRRVVDFLSRN